MYCRIQPAGFRHTVHNPPVEKGVQHWSITKKQTVTSGNKNLTATKFNLFAITQLQFSHYKTNIQ